MKSLIIVIIEFLILSTVSAYTITNSFRYSHKICIDSIKTSLSATNNEGGGGRKKRVSDNKNQNTAFENKERTLVDASKTISAASVEPVKVPESNLNTKVSNKNSVNSDGTSSLEDLFGLGDEMLGDLMEDINDFPVPREDLLTGKTVQEEEEENKGNKVFQLPDLTDFMKDGSTKEKNSLREKVASQSDSFKERITSNSGSKRNDRRKRVEEINKNRVDRSNQEEYMRVMQLNPFADADDTLFMEEVNLIL
jgi:hypothetical protein